MQALSQLSYGPTKLVSRAFYRRFSHRASVICIAPFGWRNDG